MKRVFTSLFAIVILFFANAQSIGIGTTAPNNSAALDITTAGKGLLIPRMTSANIISIANPAKGLMVYDSVKNQLLVNMGTAAAPSWQNIIATSGWGLNGNSGTNPANNFIGTTDNQPLFFRLNNQWSGMMDSVSASIYVGYGAGKNFAPVAGAGNAAIGFKALYSNTSGNGNTAYGWSALFSNTFASNNTATGFAALKSNTSGYSNTAIGSYALINNSTGLGNTATGSQALTSNITGDLNTAVGTNALVFNSTGSYNTAVGNSALGNNTTGISNTAVGNNALYRSTTGIYNTSTGMYSLFNNDAGNYNTADGFQALNSNIAGEGNTATGYDALYATTNSFYNTAVGFRAGNFYDNGYNNVFLGANVDVNGAGYYNVIAIGQGTISTGSSQVTIGNGATGSYRAYANWSNISDGRFKKNVEENVPGLDFITQLRPVTYNLNATGLDAFLHKNDKNTPRVNDKKTTASGDAARAAYNKALKEKETSVYTGFVAQEVETTAKKLGFNFSGVDAPNNENDVYGLRYAEFVVPLVKAMQEQQQQIEELKKVNKDLQKQIDEIKVVIKK
jgi:hypothetical protein